MKSGMAGMKASDKPGMTPKPVLKPGPLAAKFKQKADRGAMPLRIRSA
jgi:hypothetical protein